MAAPIGIALIGCGKIALANHLPGLALAGDRARVVALCDADPATLADAAKQVPGAKPFADYRAALVHAGVDAVVVTTPNFNHAEIVLAAVAVGAHVLCEKPLALDFPTALAMYRAARAADVRHMTAYTYRFVPAMRYLKHLVDRGDLGQVYHVRAQRFQDWADRPLGWRQRKELAGTGELADMLSHRIDYAHHLVGRTTAVAAGLRTLVPVRGGQPSDVDDWVGLLADYDTGATGVLESTKLATGVGENYGGRDVVELNGTEASAAYSTQRPLELRLARKGDAELRTIPVPREFWVWPGSPRDPSAGDPQVTFRHDQSVEFVNAIADARACAVTFRDGAAAQAVMDAAVQAHGERRWVDVPPVE